MWKSIPNNQTRWHNTNRSDGFKLSAGVKGDEGVVAETILQMDVPRNATLNTISSA